MDDSGKLVFFCGKMGAGKSTLSVKIVAENNAVLLSEDVWLAQLFPDQINSFDDYIELSRQIRPLVRQLVKDILQTGTNVVMDFPANTRRQRSWFKDLCAEMECDAEMIFLDAPDEICLQHLNRRRDEQPERAAFDTEEVFHQITRYFEVPTDAEGIATTVIRVES